MKQKKSIFFSAITGNILEYYDFTVYTVFASVIASAFFPAASKSAQILMSLAVFAVGFLTRPIGGILFGYIGDRYGRRVSLICSMLGMTIPTFSIGLIPTYNEIGMYAPVMLIVFRLVQGLCISGEGTGAAIFVLEHQNNMTPGFTAGLVQGSNIVGTILASSIGIFINKYFNHVEYAWRFAFLLGGFLGLVGFNMRLRVSETPIFEKIAESKKVHKIPFLYVIKNSWRAMFLTFCMAGVASSIVHMVKSYIIIFYEQFMHLERSVALSYSTYAYVILMISMPISGYLSDRFGKQNVVKYSLYAIFLLAAPTIYSMSLPETYQHILALTALAGLAGSISGVAYIFVITLFSPEERFSGVAFSYNLGIAVFGGTSALFSSLLVQYTGLFYSPAFYIMTTSGIFIFITKIMSKDFYNTKDE
jgi:MFS transporter, MHS family, proline/betaine transporter